MTQEEKARAYDKVSKEVKDFFEGRQKMYSDVIKTLEYLFPELKKSEDEKIKEDLIEWISDFPDMIWSGHYKKDVIAWLEKQGEQKQDVNVQINPSEYINDMGGNGCYLKNTAQASAWSKNDEYNVQCLIAKVTYDIQKGNLGRNQELIDWLKTLKYRMNND